MPSLGACSITAASGTASPGGGRWRHGRRLRVHGGLSRSGAPGGVGGRIHPCQTVTTADDDAFRGWPGAYSKTVEQMVGFM